MRIIPQILRHYLVFNTVRTVDLPTLLDHCDSYPQLLHAKRELLHDIPRGNVLIEDLIEQISLKRFHFLYKSKKEQGKEYDPLAVWEEDLAGATFTSWQLINVLRELKTWLNKQKPYRYPAEEYERLYESK